MAERELMKKSRPWHSNTTMIEVIIRLPVRPANVSLVLINPVPLPIGLTPRMSETAG